jgi:hypothetical protein
MKNFNWYQALLRGTHKVFTTDHNSIVLIDIKTLELINCGSKSLSKLTALIKNKKINNIFYRG